MTLVSPPPDELQRLRALYEDRRGPPVKAIVAAAGIPYHRLYIYARRYGWGRRRAPPGLVSDAEAGPGVHRGYACPGIAVCPERAATVRRLLATCEEQVEQAEARLATHGDDLVPEREARTLAVLARTIERLVALDQTAPKSAPTSASMSASAEGAAEDEAIPRDPAELRAELARRLAELEESGAGERIPGEPG